MKHRKMIFSDLDGTLVKEDNTISDRTLYVLDTLKKQGIRFLPVTGRSYADMRTCFPQDLHFASIVLNGALFLGEQQNVIKQDSFLYHSLIKLLDQIADFGLPAILYGQKESYLLGDHKMIQRCVETFFHSTEILYTKGLRQLGDASKLDQDILKVEVVTIDLTQRNACMKQLKKRKDCLVTSSLPFNIEITPLHVHKAHMVHQVLDYYHIQPEHALIFGDSDNDLQMFEQFPNCIAVENASEAIKKKAKTIISSCEDDGVASYLEEFIVKG